MVENPQADGNAPALEGRAPSAPRSGPERPRGDAHRARESGARRRGRRPGEGAAASAAPVAEIEIRGPLVHVAFRGARREIFHNPHGLELRPGDFVLVEADRGTDLGWVIACRESPWRRRKDQVVRALLRHATREEIARLSVLVEEDRAAREVCRGRAEHFKLEMKVIDAETQFDSNRVTFYFTADRRVDFRALVRDLARIFRTRIELRQVGARDAARRCDGIGPCGRRLCCSGFLREFEAVTLKMAKQQSLALNPAKISGSCGRLMCCLTYEVRAYQESLRQAPPLGSAWRWRDVVYVIDRLDLGNHRLGLRDAEGRTSYVELDEFRAAAIAETLDTSAAPAALAGAGAPEAAPSRTDPAASADASAEAPSGRRRRPGARHRGAPRGKSRGEPGA